MRAAVALLFLAFLILGAAFNSAAVIDAYVAWLSSETFRATMRASWWIIGAMLLVAALALLSRRAYRQLDADFPEHGGIGAADVETIKRARHD
jgi:ABC-type Fe3+-siderophore transport system permease subunit